MTKFMKLRFYLRIGISWIVIFCFQKVGLSVSFQSVFFFRIVKECEMMDEFFIQVLFVVLN